MFYETMNRFLPLNYVLMPNTHNKDIPLHFTITDTAH